MRSQRRNQSQRTLWVAGGKIPPQRDLKQEQAQLIPDAELYQPGQTMHLRALVLSRTAREAIAGKTLTFEVSDSKGNKVFKQETTTDDYGIAFTDFVLARLVNQGRYAIRAICGDDHSDDSGCSPGP